MRLVLALIVALVAAPAFAQHYAGKTVTIVVGYKPGGGYDATARILARHLPKHIPGKPNVIVQNMPGANSIIAANFVYNVAKPDGLTIATFNRNLPIGQLAQSGRRQVRHDEVRVDRLGRQRIHGARDPHRPALQEFRRAQKGRQNHRDRRDRARAPAPTTFRCCSRSCSASTSSS